MFSKIWVLIITTNSSLSYGRGYVYSLQYHLVWCTKYRKQVLVGNIETEFKRQLQLVMDELSGTIMEMEVMPDHIHMFVESLEEAQDACDFLGLPVITVGYPDLENALEKARATGADVEAIKANAGKPSFMVADLHKQLGFAVQFVEPRAKFLHDAIIGAREKWDGSEEKMFIPLG